SRKSRLPSLLCNWSSDVYLSRRLEPDECYYVANEPLVRDKLHLDLAVDPPPDLAIEVEISRDSLNRHRIYAALGVPELWRYDGEDRKGVVEGNGEYEGATTMPSY